MRSLATSSRRSSSRAYSSRTFPDPTWTASGMDGLLLEAVEHGVDVLRVGIEIEHGVEVDVRRDLVVCTHELAEVELFVPGSHGVSLHEPVRVVAAETGLDEGEQDALAEEEVVARLEVAAHTLGSDDEALDEPCEAVAHVVEREEGVGYDDALGRRVGDVALVPQRDVLEADERGPAHDARETADALRHDRVALVGHRRRALLALPERLLHLGHLGARQVADLEGEGVERGGDDGERAQELGMPVALQDLRRGRRRLEAE